MGMFDSIWFECPQCTEMIEVQSKMGDCVLKDISSDAVPLGIADDILGEQAYCHKCGSVWKVALYSTQPTTIPMKLERSE